MVPEIPFDAAYSPTISSTTSTMATRARAQLFGAFAILAVVIGCLGLFGLAAFTAERRTKEIGIRKVLGARTRDILRLLVWQFTKPVLIANLIAWPVAWWVMRGWLNGFDTRIALAPVPFLLAGGLAVLVAIVTIASHAWRVAQDEPDQGAALRVRPTPPAGSAARYDRRAGRGRNRPGADCRVA